MINQAEDLRRRLEAHAQGLPLPPKPTAPAVRRAPPPRSAPTQPPAPAIPPASSSRPVATAQPVYPKNACICSNCGCIGKPKTVTRGSIFIEIVLWLAMLIPGFIYSIWRLTTRYKACPKCLADHPIPLNTPRGQKLLKEYQRG